jgi:hypothetical protein
LFGKRTAETRLVFFISLVSAVRLPGCSSVGVGDKQWKMKTILMRLSWEFLSDKD